MNWLFKPRWWSQDRKRVERSRAQWVYWGNGTYSLSILGAVNAFWTSIGLVLVIEGGALRLRKRWW